MRQLTCGSRWLVPVLMLGAFGCQDLAKRPTGFHLPQLPGLKSLSMRSQSPERDSKDAEQDDDFKTAVVVPMVGDHTTVAGLNLIALQGVGLVTGLSGSGSDPPPSSFRTRLVEDMRRNGVKNPHAILRSSSTALVIIQAYLPPLIRKGESFDIEVRVVGADKTTSLNGGWLMPLYLSEQADVPGRGPMKGHVYAKAKGPILISTRAGESEARTALLRRGKVLGGGISLKDRNLTMYLRNKFRNVRNSKRIADRIGQRFSDYDRSGLKRPLAKAKTDERIELMVPLQYRDNYPRYLQVIRNIAFRETDVAQRVRMKKLEEQLNISEKSERASLRLEAIGTQAVPILRTGLENPSLEVRFHSAIALTYLNESDGLQVLAEAAREEPAFRVFALAALPASEDAAASLVLRELLNESSAETRYGAWRALTKIDRRDPIVRDEGISDEFQFHVLKTTGPEMIHLTNRKKAEIVLFGDKQRFQTPLTLRAGTDIRINASAGSQTITVSRYAVGKPDRRRVVSTRIADVIRAAAELDATYPDIAQMLAQADRQHNIPGGIEVDAIPQAGRTYYRPGTLLAGDEKRSTRVGNPGQSPNLFLQRNGSKRKRSSRSRGRFGEIELDSGNSSAVDIREEDDEDETVDKKTRDGDKPRKWYELAGNWKWPFGQKETETAE